MRLGVVVAMLAALVPLTSGPRTAYACSCAPLTRAEKIERSEIVLEGRVERLSSPPGESSSWEIAALRVDKGQVADSFTLYDWGGSCSVQLEVGARYFMALSRDPSGYVRIADCSLREWLAPAEAARTTGTASREPDPPVQVVPGHPSIAGPTRVSEAGTDSSGVLALTLTLVTALAAGAAVTFVARRT